MTSMPHGATVMNNQEEQLVEQLADLRRDEVTRLTTEDRKPQSMDTGMGLTEEQRQMWEPAPPEPLFPAMADPTTPITEAGGSNVKQYGLPKGAIELQDLIEHREMNFAIGNIFKACYRMDNCDHSDARRDLNKIIWFANRELKRL